MTRIEKGGTDKWCPNCKKIRVCAAVNPTQLGESAGQRWHNEDHPDISWFRRGLVCQTCDHHWLTAEVEESFLDELVELRDSLGRIKMNAEAYARESNSASESLRRLSESLEVLRGLQIYTGSTDPVLQLSIDTLELPIETTKILKDRNVFKFADLVQLDESNLAKSRNLTSNALTGIKEALACRGLSLGMKLE